MHKSLNIKRTDLDKTKDAHEYLNLIRQKYIELWGAEPDNLADNFTDDHFMLIYYMVLYDQVQNGGFLQLLFNGYGNAVFDSPMINTLKEWGALELSTTLERIKQPSMEVDNELKNKEKTLDILSKLYKEYPEFDHYDKEFYHNDGILEIKAYVESHMSDFIIIE